MRRRDAIPMLSVGAVGLCLARPCLASGRAAPLSAFVGNAQGAAVLLDVKTRELMGVHEPRVAEGLAGLPGSTIKPLALGALLRLGRLTAREGFACPGRLSIGGHELNCSHPEMAAPMKVDSAIAYSCNCFTAHFAARLQPGELSGELDRVGLASWNGRVTPARSGDAIRLQALGEDAMWVTLMGLASAYRGLALHCEAPVLEGLEGAVEYGTAQLAAVGGLRVAGKTGSTGAGPTRLAWFAGFAPSREARVVCAVLLHGQSGGGDAAPVAGRILSAWRQGKV